jgi:hypothetical protein
VRAVDAVILDEGIGVIPLRGRRSDRAWALAHSTWPLRFIELDGVIMALEAGPGKTAMGHARVFGARVDEWTDEGERKVDSARPVLLSQRQRSQIVPMITELYIEPPTRRRRRHLHYSYTHLLLLLRCFK